MLVLTRRPNEAIEFLHTGIRIRVLKLRSNAVQLGIEAPHDVTVLRQELTDPAAPIPARRPSRTHAVCNQLNKLGLMLHRFEQQWRAGQAGPARDAFEQALALLEGMDRDWVAAHVEAPAAPAPAPRLRPLVVEDDGNERALLAGLLNMHGCDCSTAADGVEALNFLARNDRPDLVLLDMNMPRCDGRRTLAEIRANPRYDGLRVFAISGSRQEDVGIATGPGGVDAWFPKPLNPRKLWAAIQDGRAAPPAVN